MELCRINVRSDSNISPLPCVEYAKSHGLCNVIGDVEQSVYTDLSTSRNSEVYGGSATVVVDEAGLKALYHLQRLYSNAIRIEIVDITDIPSDGMKIHELYIVLDDMRDAIANYKGDKEDYYRPTGINTNKVEKEYTPMSILFDILHNHIKQVVVKYTNIGMELQDIYAKDLTNSVSADIISTLNETIMTDITLSQDPDRVTKSMIKIASAIAMRIRELLVVKLGEIMAKNSRSYSAYPIDLCMCDLNGQIMSTIVDYTHILYGFNYTNRNLKKSITNSLNKDVIPCDTSYNLVKFIASELPNLLLENIDRAVKAQGVAPPMSYYNLALLTFDELKPIIIDACADAVECEECIPGTEYTHMNDVCDLVPIFVEKVVDKYLCDFYPFCESTLNAICIDMVQTEMMNKLQMIVSAGILNTDDYRVNVYIDDDVTGDDYCKSYGFISFKQNVTPFQIGLAKTALEQMTWDVTHAEYMPIELRVNKIKTR